MNRSVGSRKVEQMVGHPRPVLGVGLAVPMSIPRYTSIESTEQISAPRSSASASAASVFPLAVGPTSARSGGPVAITPAQVAPTGSRRAHP